MNTTELFLASDAALRSVVDRISPDDIGKAAPAEWTSIPNPTIRDILGRHAYDEAWISGLIAGKSSAEADEWEGRDLLGDDPIAAYDSLNDAATAAIRAGVDPESTFRFSYGDYPAKEGFAHMAMYRAFQAWQIAKHLSIPFHFTPELVAGMNEHVVPDAELWRSIGVLPPAIDPPAGADAETRLLCVLGYWVP